MPYWDREVFERVLLGFLVERPAHGYELAAQFEPGGDLVGIASLGKSRLYALLHTLEGQGWATAALQAESGGPARKVFSATAAGREEFSAWLGCPVPSLRRLRLEFVFKLYFYRRLERPGVEDLLAAQMALLTRRQAGLCAPGVPENALSPQLRSLQQRLLGAALEWLAEQRVAAAQSLPSGSRGDSP